MSYPTHLLRRNEHYYYKIKIPVDLQQHFPTPFISKSLRTTDLQEAKTILVAMEYRTHKVFTMLRTGMLSDDIAKQVVRGIVPVREKEVVVKGLMLSDVIRQYTFEKEAQWTPKTKMEMAGVFKLVVDILGDVAVKSLNRQALLDMRSSLMKLPANSYKKYPGQTIKQLLSRNDIPPMSIKSVNKYMGGIGAVLRYCANEGLIVVNYASGLKISEKNRPDEERSIYDIADIKRIFDNLPHKKVYPERYWIPLIGCYSGMRLNEICQLYIEDVQEIDGIWCFSVNGDKDKRLKNQTSERVIPIHPKLIELGFIYYWETIKKTEVPRLWMKLTWMDVNGYSNNFGKWYQRFNREFVTTNPKKVFHSFRHVVTDTLKQAGVQDSIIAELVGHSQGAHSMTMSRYGKRYQPRVLLEAMKHLDYGIIIPEWKT